MPQVALTDLAIRALSPPLRGQKTCWDGRLPGFGIRVSTGGTKSFVGMYGADRKRITIGRFPKITVKQARDEAKKLFAQIELGTLDSSKSPWYSDAVEMFLEACALKNRPITVREYRRMLERHFRFSGKRLDQIGWPDIRARLGKLSKTPTERRYAFVVARTFFNWSVREQLLDQSPLANMKPPSPPQSRERVLTETELASILVKAKESAWPFGPIVHLLALTGQRRSEIGSLQWSWIDLNAREIRYPSEFTKNHRPHTIPLGPSSMTIIDELPQLGDVVFPGATAKATFFNGWSKCKQRLDAQLDDVEPWVLHDLRRTFSSTMARLDTPLHVTEKLLNHASGSISGVAAIYNRYSHAEEMRSAIERYDAHITALLD